ncbi:asparagine synthase-related protein [Vibrio sp. Of7-15]|uniref:asparagine synthase-related protein n=1 Tax=Vibrio sp. Of7-15 TaxID=2724879 RepID=UPI001EF1E291|nr:asparagine synthase-related protein [Vibrio sp. Of7-15]MCG7497283.1 asparagine synthase-related protein [Vibrio sp. Of7-15]
MDINNQDLVFGKSNQIIVFNGKKDFIPLSKPSDSIKIYFCGTLLGENIKTIHQNTKFGELFGHFIILIHDVNNDELKVINDRYGMLPFYYHVNREKIIFSRTLMGIFRHGVTAYLDDSALSDVAAYNVPFLEKTLYKKVSSLSGATQFIIDIPSLNIKKRKTWEPAKLLYDADVPLEEVKEELLELLLEGVQKATSAEKNKVGVTLSGGIDSRVLLAAGLHLELDVEAYTTGIEGSRSLAYAKEMSSLCGVKHFSYPLGHQFHLLYGDLVKDNMSVTEGMTFSSEAEAHWLRDHIEPDRVMMHGAFAELYKVGHMHNYPLQSQFIHNDPYEVAQKIWERFSNRYQYRKKIFSQYLQTNLAEQAKDNLANIILSYPQDIKASGWLQNLYIDEHLSKVASTSAQIWNEHLPTYFPFSYPPFVDLLLRVRAEDKVKLDFPKYVLKKLNPILAQYPDANTGTKIGAPWLIIEMIHIYNGIFHRLFGNKKRYDHMDVVSWLQNMSPSLSSRLSHLNNSLYDIQYINQLEGDLFTKKSQQKADCLLLLLMFDMWLKQGKVLCKNG